eukprot:s868_g30.t1
MAYSSGAENLKRRRLHLQSPENIAEASPEFFIGPQKEKLRSKYRASSLEHNGYPVFYAEGRPGRDAEWIFRAGDGFQCNYGNSFETSRPRYWTPDNPWVPGNHSWEQFISKTGEWKLFGQFETTVIQRQDSFLAGCVNASESAGEHGSTKVLPADELLSSQDTTSIHPEASPEFFIGPQKEKLRSKYRASSWEHNGYPVFYAEGRPGRDAEWIFRAGDGFQCNYGVPGNHSWEQFISKTGEWKLFGQFETTVIQRQDSLLAGCVNASESAGEHGSTKVLPVDELLYSQDSISPHFSDKRPLKELIDQLNAWELDPMKAGFLCLDVMEINGKVYSVDNRRLYCLKQHQASAQPWQVFAKVKVTPVEDPLLVRVLVRGLKNGGREIRVREPGVDIGREGPNIRRF